MSSSSQSPASRLLFSILFFCALTSALPQLQPQHQHVAPREDNADLPVTLVAKPDPNDISNDFDSFLEQGSKLLKSLFGTFLKWGQSRGQAAATTTMIHISPTPVEASSSGNLSTAVVVSSTKPSVSATSSEGEIIFHILPIFPIPSPNPGPNETTTTTISYAPALPLSAYGSGFPTYVPVPSGSVTSASAISAGLAAPIGRLENTTQDGIARPTRMGHPLIPATGLPLVEQNTTIVLHVNRTTTVYFTLPYITPNTTAPMPTATGFPASVEQNTTMVVNYTRTTVKFVTRTVRPIPAILIAAASRTPPVVSTISTPRYLNTSSVSLLAQPTAPALINIPILIPGPKIGSNFTYGTLAGLRRFCTFPNPQRAPLTLPLITYFYGPSAYPLLHAFPGCEQPNPSQSLRAPGLLNCTLLGEEVQRCQQNGRRVMLSIKGSPVTDVGGNFDYGTPGQAALPFGAYYGEDGLVDVDGSANATTNATSSRLPVPPKKQHPNLFDPTHPPTSLALTLSSLFGETKTERADLRPLGPEPLTSGIDWRPLGEEVVVDGYDVQIPREWKGTVQGGLFEDFVQRLRELTDESWRDSGARKGGKNDLGADGKGTVLVGWV